MNLTRYEELVLGGILRFALRFDGHPPPSGKTRRATNSPTIGTPGSA